MANVLEIRNLSKSFEELVAVDDVSFAVEDEFFAFLGPSGSGKTTTLRMIAGLEIPDRGEIFLEGENITTLPPEKRNVNTIFQNYALFPHMTVFDNVAFGLRRKKLDKNFIKQEVSKYLKMVGLEDKANRLPRELSGGEKQRVALIRGLINKPKLLLLDEPLGALDLKIRQKLAIDLVNIREQVNISFVYVTHDQTEALTMADRIAVMNKGKILQIGEPKELYENPCCSFVARFIGNTNFLNGRVEEKRGEFFRVSVPGVGDIWGIPSKGRVPYVEKGLYAEPFRGKDSLESDIRIGMDVNLSIRPEKVSIARERVKKSEHNSLSGVVKEIIYVGPSTEFIVTLENGKDFRVFAQNITPQSEIWKVTWDDRVYLSWRFDKTLILVE